jgi:xanthine dehydrogenase accessory factor
VERLARAIAEAVASNIGAALATVVKAPPQCPAATGNKMVVYLDGSVSGTLGSPDLDQQVREEAIRSIPPQRSALHTFTFRHTEDQIWEVEVFIEVFATAAQLLILGAGHIAVPLVKLGKLLGFTVTVLDDRASFANRERFPEADHILVGDFDQVLRDYRWIPNTYVVLVTRGHEFDVVSLRHILYWDVAYIGMIGSKRRVWAVHKLLHEEGMPVERLQRLYAPIGLDIAAETPAEIAVSIMAEIIKVRRGGRAESLSDRLRPLYAKRLLGRLPAAEPDLPD